MAKYLPGCLANNKIIIARTFIFFSCTIGFIFQIISLRSQSGPAEGAEYLLAALAFITCSLGLYGAYKRDPLILRIFAALVVFINLVTIISAYRVLLHDNNSKTELASMWEREIADYDWFPNRAIIKPKSNGLMFELEKPDALIKNRVTKSWDKRQRELKCCGISGYLDWSKTRPKELDMNILPESCCSTLEDGQCLTRDAFKIGCLDQMEAMQHMLGMALIITRILNTILTILACYLIMQENTPTLPLTIYQQGGMGEEKRAPPQYSAN